MEPVSCLQNNEQGGRPMSSLSRTYARESKRGKKLMEQYQPPGAYDEVERKYEAAQEAKKVLRKLRKED